MFETHTTKTGESMLICQMENSHLENTIKFFCREIEKCRKILIQPTAENQLIAIFNPTYSQANLKAGAEKSLKNYHQMLQPYLAEAFLRKLHHLSTHIQVAYGRTQAVTNAFEIQLEIAAGDDDDDYQDDDTSHPGHPIHYGDN